MTHRSDLNIFGEDSPLVLAEKAAARRNMLLILAGGALAAGAGVSALWKGHRVGGFALGALLGGPVVGFPFATLYAFKRKTAIEAMQEQHVLSKRAV